MKKMVCISDTHNQMDKIVIPDCDFLVISGDITMKGTHRELIKFNDDLAPLKGRVKNIILVAGNHDFLFQRDTNLAKSFIPNVTHYLQDDYAQIDGVKFYGSPWQPWFHNWAFNLHRGPQIKAKWDFIPNGIDVLITHGPPKGMCDETSGDWGPSENVGCQDLMDAVQRVKPKYHIFGHIHHAYGVKDFNGTTYINASTCNEKYKPFNAPIVIDIGEDDAA